MTTPALYRVQLEDFRASTEPRRPVSIGSEMFPQYVRLYTTLFQCHTYSMVSGFTRSLRENFIFSCIDSIVWRYGLDSTGSGWWQLAGSCKHFNGALGSMTGADYEVLKHSASWIRANYRSNMNSTDTVVDSEAVGIYNLLLNSRHIEKFPNRI
jgi:hypothetical protein